MTPKEFSDMDDWYFEAWLDRLGHIEYISDQHDLGGDNIHTAFFVSLLWHSCVL